MKTVTITMNFDGEDQQYTKVIECEGKDVGTVELLFKAMQRAMGTTFYEQWAKRITKEEAAEVLPIDRFWHYLSADKKSGKLT